VNLWTESLWGDEGFSAIAVQQSIGEMINVVMKDTAPPLFYLIGFVWGRLFGFSEVALRSLSLLLVVGASIFVGLLVYELRKSKMEGLLAGLLTFFSPFLNKFGFEWRMYALLAFTTMGSVYFFVTRKWKGWVILTTMMLYTHHFGLFTVACQGLWFMVSDFKWKKRNTKIGWWWHYFNQLKAFVVVALLYLPWLYPMYIQTLRVKGGGFWLGVPSVENLTDLLYRMMVGGLEEKYRVIAVLMVVVLLILKQWKQVTKKWLEIAVIGIGPVLMAFLVSRLITPVFYDRYLLSVIGVMAVLVVIGTAKRWWWVAIMLVLGYGVVSWIQFTHPSKAPFRMLAAVVKNEMKEGDVLVNYNGRSHHLWETRYYGIPAAIYTPNGPLPLYVGTAQMKGEDTIDELPITEGRLGLVASEPIETIRLPGYKLVESKNFGSLVFSWWIKQ